MPKETFAQWLLKQRTTKGHTQAEMAVLLQMGRSKYMELENAQREPSYSNEHGLRPLVLAIPAKK
jgi:transcriptional regulator with XRE-family HTH domain